jgi:hypothetical protein
VQEWSVLLAATFVTVLLALRVSVASALVETYLTPQIVCAAIGV